MRVVVLTALDNKRLSLGTYVRAVKAAKANPEAIFREGLSCWWPCSGREVVNQFWYGAQDRINQGIPYHLRGSF